MFKTTLLIFVVTVIVALASAVPLGKNKKVLRFGVHALTGDNHDSALPNIIRIARMQRQKASSS